VPREDVDLLVAAAWLHDIGYAESLHDTGFHPLDGARYLRAIGAPDRLCRLVAHHTGAQVEAANRGLLDTLMGEFPPEESETAEALTYADLTTGPEGSPISALERVLEILVRYPPDHVVHESIQHARPELLEIAARVDARLAGIRLQVGNRKPDAQLGGPFSG
jgi:HD superfamily phosphodiesterase